MRYIDAEELTDYMLERYNELCDKHGDYDHYTTGYGDAIDAIENAPTADVVPKSEVDKWKKINEQLHKEMSEQMLEEVKVAKKYLAREIFEELERYIYFNFRFAKEESAFGEYSTDYLEGRIEMGNDIKKLVAELKKKYIGGI